MKLPPAIRQLSLLDYLALAGGVVNAVVIITILMVLLVG